MCLRKREGGSVERKDREKNEGESGRGRKRGRKTDRQTDKQTNTE